MSTAEEAQSSLSEADVYSDKELFAAICAQIDVIWVRADLDLREEHWPANCKAPVVLKQNMTISGPLDKPLTYTVSFNFMARKVVILPYGEVRLRRLTARNTRRGGGGEIDFIAYSPKGILWTDDLNKNQIICAHTDPNKLTPLPLPVGFPEYAGRNQIVSLWDQYCTPSRCWDEVLHYEQFFTDVNVGSDTETGGYVMAKNNASKTCDDFVTDACAQSLGLDKCMMNVISSFLATLHTASGSSGVNTLAVALPVALGGAALLAVIVGGALLLSRRQRLRREAEEAAAAAAAAAKKLYDTDLESGGGGGGGRGRGSAMGVRGGSKELERGSSSDSRDVASGSSSGDQARGGGGRAVVAGPRPQDDDPYLRGEDGLEDSFRYETGDDMGRCLSGHRGGAPANSVHSASSGTGAALVEGLMQDGSTCTIAVGSPLGQGSYGVVFKGSWRDRPVAVKLILCDPRCSEQVGTEVKLMTSATCRHPNLLRAYACMTRARLVNRMQPAGQALQSTLRSLNSSSARRAAGTASEAVEAVAAVVGAADSGRSSNAPSVDQAETWIVSEYCDLGALAPHVHGAKRFLFPPDTATPGGDLRRPRVGLILGCLRDIAAGMAHLHSLNIVHGDLKMANVLLSTRPPEREGEEGGEANGGTPAAAAAEGEGGSGRAEEPAASVLNLPPGGSAFSVARPSSSSGLFAQLPPDIIAKVADFGLSRWLKEGQTHHSTKTVGTVTHMPPELLRSGKLTLSGDVYSFGIIMWELLTGCVPYRGLMYGEVVERVVVSHRRPEFPEHTPVEYRSLAERCWAAEASARPTFAAVLGELESMLASAEELQCQSDRLLATLAAAKTPHNAAAAAAAPGGAAAGSGGPRPPNTPPETSKAPSSHTEGG